MFKFTTEQADAIREQAMNQPTPWQYSMEEAFANTAYEQGQKELAMRLFNELGDKGYSPDDIERLLGFKVKGLL